MLNLPKVEEPQGLNDYPVLYWNHVGLEMNRITHSLGGPQTGPTMSSRALGMLHLAMHDAYFAVLGHTEGKALPTWLPDAVRPPVPPGLAATLDNANAALTGAAVAMLDMLYGPKGPGISISARETLDRMRDAMIMDYGPHIDMLAPALVFGQAVAGKIHSLLAVRADEPGADAGRYEPKQGPRYFRDEPQVPVRLEDVFPDEPNRATRAVRVYHGPFYGTTARDFAVTDPDGHRLAHYPKTDYGNALKEVRAVGGAAGQPGTTRVPDQTVAALYWAYDGANLIGTPPRLYNQILRVIAWDKRDAALSPQDQTSEFVRLFALANVAMADAGKFAWREKYRFELWRPLSGIREHVPDMHDPMVALDTIDPDADPFWLALGAPETNTNRITFKPPFPAYPSGHATFGAACFQMIRLFYAQAGRATVDPNGSDDIAFSFVSEEMNGISRDLHQPYDATQPLTAQPGLVRTRVPRRFGSLWRAIFENAISRVWLGVHWRFDAFDHADAASASDTYRNPEDIHYSHVWTAPRAPDTPEDALPIGGVPLGLGIANDIFGSGMKMAPSLDPHDHHGPVKTKSSNTGYHA